MFVRDCLARYRCFVRLPLRTAVLSVMSAAALATVGVTPAPIHAATAGTYYVATTGVDSGSCTSNAPCKSLQYATSLAGPGSTVVVAAGNYGPQVVTAVGTASAPVLVQANGRVVLTRPLPASQLLQSTPLLQISNSAHLRVDGFTVAGMKNRWDYQQATQPYGGEVILQDHSTATGTDIVLSNLVVAHANQTCVKTQDQESYVTVTNSTLYDCGQPGNGLDHGVYMTGPNSSVLNSVVNGSTGYGIHFWGSLTTNATVEGNNVQNARSAGILVQGDGAVISGNWIQHNAWGISGYASATITGNAFIGNSVNTGGTNSYGILFSTMTHEDIEHNTFYRDGTEVQSNGGGDGTSVIRSNIFVALNQYVKMYPAYRSGDVVDYNDYYGGVAPTVSGLHSLTANPLFDAAPSNLQLSSTSPCIGRGLNNTNMGAF